MICYVETNFILEIVYQQEQHDSCEALIGFGEKNAITLAVPAFALAEARLSFRQKAKGRRGFHEHLIREISELTRSKPFAALSIALNPLTTAIVKSIQDESDRLDATTLKLLEVCKVLPTTPAAIRRSLECERRVDLSSQDALVYASILEDRASTAAEAAVFLNRNSRDFLNPTIDVELKDLGCDLIPSFEHGLAAVRAAIKI